MIREEKKRRQREIDAAINAAARGAVARGVGHYLPPGELPAGTALWLKEGVQDALRAGAVRDS